MTIATQRRMSLEAYLSYDDGTETRYELVDGVLVEMGAESTLNIWIAGFLYGAFLQLGLPTYQVGFKQKIQVDSAHVSARAPDLMIHSEDSVLAIEGQSESCLRLNDPNPLLVVEIVSPGPESSDNYQRDYVQKPKEYAARGISELWIVDPGRAVVKVGCLLDGLYQFQDFTDDQPLVSQAFPKLTLTVEQILRAGR